MKDLEGDFVDNEEILKIVNEMKKLIAEGKNENYSIKDLRKDYPDEIEKLEEALLNYIAEIDLKSFKTEFPDKWKYLPK